MTSAAVHSAAAPRDVRARARVRASRGGDAHLSPRNGETCCSDSAPSRVWHLRVVPSRDRRGTTPETPHILVARFPRAPVPSSSPWCSPVPRVRHPRLGRAGPGPVRARERRKRKRRPRQTGRRGRRRVRPVDGAPGPERGPAARGRERVRARDVRVHRHGRRLDRRDGSRERRRKEARKEARGGVGRRSPRWTRRCAPGCASGACGECWWFPKPRFRTGTYRWTPR